MALTNKLITFNKLTSFETQLAQGNILETSIVFIKDAKKIWTKGTYFDCSGGGSSNIAVYETTDDVYNGVLNSTAELNLLIGNSSIYTLIIIQKSSAFDKRIFVFNASDQRLPMYSYITYTCVYSESPNDTNYATNPILYQIARNEVGGLYLNKHPLALKSDIPNTDNFVTKSGGTAENLVLEGGMLMIEGESAIQFDIAGNKLRISDVYGGNKYISFDYFGDGTKFLSDDGSYKTPSVDTSKFATQANLTSAVTQLTTNIAKKQDKLVSGTNIKTINSTSLLGSGNIAIKDTKNLTYSLNNSTSGTVTLLPNVCIYMPNPLTGKLAINACATISSNNADLIESRICFRMPNNASLPVIQFNGVAIRWAGGNAPTFEADFTYEISLFYPSNANSVGPMGVCVGFK